MKKWLALLGLLFPSFVFAQNSATANLKSGGSACLTTGSTPNCVALKLASNTTTVSVQITGTFSGTAVFETSADGTTYSAFSMTPNGGGSAVTSTTGTGIWNACTSALSSLRVRVSSLVSGTVVATLLSSTAAVASCGGGGGGGTVTDVTASSPVASSGGSTPDISCSGCEITTHKNQASGYAGLDGSTKLSAAQLPNPSASTLGGTQSYAAVSHQFLDSISTSGVPHSSAIVAGDVPTLNQNTSGNAATATALAANPSNCVSGKLAAGIDASGAAEGCADLTGLGFGKSVVWAPVLPGGSVQMGSCTVTSGSPNFSCTTAIWDSTMVGFLIRANTTNQANAFAVGTTVSSITDATHGVASANASYSNSGATIGLFPRDETSTINTAIGTALSLANCGTVLIPRGTYLVTDVFSNLATIPSGCAQWANGSGPFFHIEGWPITHQGKATALVIPSDFPWADCTLGSGSTCFPNFRAANITFNGMNYQTLPAGAQNKVLVNGTGSDIGVHHLGQTSVTGFVAFALAGNGGICLRCVFDQTGTIDWAGNFGSFSGYVEGGSYIRVGASGNLQINGDGTQINGMEFYGGNGKAYCAQGTILATSSIGGSNVSVRSTSNNNDIYLDGCSINTTSANGVFLANTGSNVLRVHMTHTTVSGSPTNFLSGPVQYFDDGGNTIQGAVSALSGSGFYAGDGSVTGTLDVAGNHVLTSGWGTANVNTLTGMTKAVTFTISVTGGVPAASPVLTDTFATTFTVAPNGGCTLTQIGGTFGVLSNPVPSSLTATGVVWTFTGTAVSGQSYVFQRTCRNN